MGGEVIRKPQWAIDRIGLSTDTKGTDAIQGTTFYEQDTGDTYIFLSGTWALKYSPEASVHNKVFDLTTLTWVAEPYVDSGHPVYVTPGTGASFPVTGTVTVNAASLPLPAGASTETSDEQLSVVLRQLIGAMRDPIWLDMPTNSLKALLLSGSTTAVTGTLTGITNIGGFGADQLVQNLMESAWGVNTRTLLT